MIGVVLGVMFGVVLGVVLSVVLGAALGAAVRVGLRVALGVAFGGCVGCCVWGYIGCCVGGWIEGALQVALGVALRVVAGLRYNKPYVMQGNLTANNQICATTYQLVDIANVQSLCLVKENNARTWELQAKWYIPPRNMLHLCYLHICLFIHSYFTTNA